MVSLALAKKLKRNGVEWSPRPNDYFAIPDRGLDERIFVISELMTDIAKIRGLPMVSFHGSAEWATDYLVASEVVWLPRESQMRTMLLTCLQTAGHGPHSKSPTPVVNLRSTLAEATVSFEWRDESHHFQAPSAADAYALAYLYINDPDRSTGVSCD